MKFKFIQLDHDYCGYHMIVGPDVKPFVKELGNVKSVITISDSSMRDVDEMINEKDRVLKLLAEIPGMEKSDIQVNVADGIVSTSAERRERKYGIKIPLKYDIDENSVKTKYTNDILELTFSIVEVKPKGKIVSVE